MSEIEILSWDVNDEKKKRERLRWGVCRRWM